MKKCLLLILSAGFLVIAGCSRSDKSQSNATPQSTPDVERLKSESERLQQATANAAREREKANQTSSPSPSVSP
jgi:outer membrane murein-binding lipoprotein Lpp